MWDEWRVRWTFQSFSFLLLLWAAFKRLRIIRILEAGCKFFNFSTRKSDMFFFSPLFLKTFSFKQHIVCYASIFTPHPKNEKKQPRWSRLPVPEPCCCAPLSLKRETWAPRSIVKHQLPREMEIFFFVCTEIYIFLVFYVDDYVHVYIICICKIILVFYNIKVFFLYRGEFMPWKKSDGLERFFWTNAPRKFFRRTFQNGALVKWRLDLLGLIRIDIPYLLEWVYIYIYIHVSHYMLRF